MVTTHSPHAAKTVVLSLEKKRVNQEVNETFGSSSRTASPRSSVRIHFLIPAYLGVPVGCKRERVGSPQLGGSPKDEFNKVYGLG